MKYREASTAVDASAGNDGATIYCEATDDNLTNLRQWAAECDRRRPRGRRYGETAASYGRVFRGFDDDVGEDWCVVILDVGEEVRR